MAAQQAKLGSWWLFIICSQCHRQMLLAEVPSPDQEPNLVVEGGQATCPHCHVMHRYRANQVRRQPITRHA
jgi:hypothetical protein